MEVKFSVNGVKYVIKPGDLAPNTSLNTYLRSHLVLTGTKFSCLEGGCGCCIVSVHGLKPVTGEPFTMAVNSCLFLVYSCHGLDVITIEGLGNRTTGYHPLQERLAEYHGTQCGYCSPGQVMNMYSLYESKFGSVTAEEIEDSFGGNICRCTGYRPILDAFKSFASNAPQDSLCQDIEDLSLRNCPKTGKICAGKCGENIHIEAADNAEWHKVGTLAEVLDLLNGVGSKTYRLVAGNTAHGIYPMPYNIEVFIDVSSVIELKRYSITSVIELGGNVAIADWMRILLEAADRTAGFTYCQVVRDHLNRIATVPVRNVGTIAGNLMIKHDHKEFYSDVFLILETIGATITITDKTGNVITVSPKDFLNLDMEKKVITKITMPQLAPDQYRLIFYKMTDRAQNAITFMNVSFLLELPTGSSVVKSARIVFGGVNPDFVHATTIEKYLKGQDLFDNATIQKVADLIDAFYFDDTLPNTSAEFRRKLAIGLFYKTVLKLAPRSKIRPFYQSGSTLIYRPLSSGKQKFVTTPADYPLTKPIMKLEALCQTSGEAQYVNDVHAQNALFGTFVLSNDPLKTIEGIDASAALAVKGVKAFYSAKDIPGENSFITSRATNLLAYPNPEEVFCSGKVLYHGQPVGVILAEELSQAIYAAGLVKIKYVSKEKSEKSLTESFLSYFKGEPADIQEKVLPTLKDVLKEDYKLTEHRYQIPIIVKAATHTGVVQGSNSVKGHMFCDIQAHFTMETQHTLAIPNEDGMDLFPATQWMDLTNMGVANVLGVHNNTIMIRVRRLGGAFGCKISRATFVAAAAAIACYRSQQPIRMILSVPTTMRAIGKRTPAFSQYDVDFNDQGVVQRLNFDVTHDLGCSVNEPMDFLASLYTSNVYVSSTWNIVYHEVVTDSPSNTLMRCPGSMEVISNAETVMEHMAWILKKDAIEVRMANVAADHPIRQITKDFLASCEFYKRLAAVKKYNKENRWKKRGISLSLMQFPEVFGAPFETLISVYHGDGSVGLTLGGIDGGQGLNTKCTQIAASILGIPIDMIKVKPCNNITSANTFLSAGDMPHDAVGVSVKICCEILRDRVAPYRNDKSWSEAVQAAHMAAVELIVTHQFVPADVPIYNVYGASCCEIEIDILTGDFQLRRVDIVEDVGRSINPTLDVGQVEGGFMMGVGYMLHEKLIYNRSTGELLTDRFWNYKVPGAKDIPVDFRINLLQTQYSPFGAMGSKAASEPATTLAIVVLQALRKALESARKDAGAEDIFIVLHTGTTKEDILRLAATKNSQFTL